MKQILFLVFILGLLFSCNNTDHFGFKRLENSIHYKLIALGDEESSLKNADYVSLGLVVYSDTNHLATKEFKRVKLTDNPFPEYLLDILQAASSGDSVMVIGNSSELDLVSLFHQPLVEHHQEVVIELKVKEVFTDSALRQQLAIERMQHDFELQETTILNLVLDSLSLSESDNINGIYLKPIRQGNGRQPVKGDFVSTDYILRLPNGKELANTYLSESFEYQVGKPDQAIQGFAIAIYEMSVAGKYIAVVPSKFGFGEKGSSSGLVPPYSILVYEVELHSAS